MSNIKNIPFANLFYLLTALPSNYKYYLLAQTLLMLISALVEALTILSFVPMMELFLSIPAKSSSDFRPINSLIYNLLPYFQNSVGLVVLTFIILSLFLRALNLFTLNKLTAIITIWISRTSFRNFFSQDLSTILRTNSSEIISSLTVYVGRVGDYIRASLQLITVMMLTIFAFASIIFIDYMVILILAGVVVFPYLFILKYINKEFSLISKAMAINNQNSVKVVQETFGGIRDVMLLKNLNFYSSLYAESQSNQRINQAKLNFLAIAPKYFVETLLLITLGVYAIFSSQNSSIYASLSAIAFGSLKVLSSIQAIVGYIGTMKQYSSPLNYVVNLLKIQPRPNSLLQANISRSVALNKCIIWQTLEFANVSFSYKNAKSYSVKDISFKLFRGEKLGIIGTSGAGKSTLIDLLLGLMNPSSGNVVLKNGNESVLSDLTSLSAHVPQHIFLIASTIAENVAFGIKLNKIDIEKVKWCCKVAQIHSYIDSLPNSYFSAVGERGNSLSGGQIQRIGIARALYLDRDIIILDESTNALDADTELKLLNALHESVPEKTIILIAHRLSAIKNFDRYIKMDKGRLVDQGSPVALI